MSDAVILQHSPNEGPGRLLTVLRDFGIPCHVRRLWMGDEVPSDLDDLRCLIVLPGTMRVADVGNEKFPFLAKEIDLLKRVIQTDRPCLSIGLGAQLLAHAAGAKVYPNVKMAPPAGHGQPPKPVEPIEPLPEYGWGPVNFPFPGGTEPIVFGLSDGVPMFQWHSDTFDLPKLPSPANPPPPPAPPPPTGNVLIASTRTCRNQAYRFKNRLFGFQFHFHYMQADIEKIVSANKDDLAKIDPNLDSKIREETKTHYARYARLGDRIIGNFVQFTKVY
jgi:GMP synthase-like glutamine amidotransferase